MNDDDDEDEYNNETIEPLTYLYNYYSMNPNITIKFIDNNINLISFEDLSSNLFSYSNKNNIYYCSFEYKKKLCNKFMDICEEELISKVCTPKRILNWNDDVLLDKEHPLYGYTQQEINNLINEKNNKKSII
jgi:hypothetical protein